MLLLASAIYGVWLTIVGATRVHERALFMHGGLAAAGLLMLVVWLHGWAGRAGRVASRAAMGGTCGLCQMIGCRAVRSRPAVT